MKFQTLSVAENSEQYLSLMQQGAAIKRHVELLEWLQGDVQQYVPHDILMTGWGNFDEGCVQHDILSSLPGVRSYAVGTACLPFLLGRMNDRWVAGGRIPCRLGFGEFRYLLGSSSFPNSFCESLLCMKSGLVHGISDVRSKSDSVYVFLSTREFPSDGTESDGMVAASLAVLVPVIDTALRQISQLPQQQTQPAVPTRNVAEDATGLSERETQIRAWVAMGKTNSEIGTILSISGFTVKNHMQRIFQKLNVFNRAQAVSKVTRVALDA